ncbi:unnamed protein product [Notodromas monacha]|uniref:Ig-like domain-containing protein n=1 Tax=Notodromas monacha TaxID=399045 RepID=A0A7R9BIM1_9CRUS|nr:unnamed protein product [Notodromas monacha]CAG0916204.1 unnamed protein product [Notodromas monacha]
MHAMFPRALVVKGIAKPLDFVIWYRNDTEVLNYDQTSNMEKIETRLMALENGSLSQLTIRDATFSDTGNYTCSAPNTDPVRVQVYVSEGDIQAPVQRKSSASGDNGVPVPLALVAAMAALFQAVAR